MERILVLVKNRRNQELLIDELKRRYIVLSGEEGLSSKFDLSIVDGISLDKMQGKILLRRHEESPLFLPFLLITTREDIGYATKHLWKVVDELIFLPIEKIELQARIEILLRARRYSIQIKDRLEELELFSHALGHDLKAPLRAIRNFLGFLKEECYENFSQKAKDYFQRIVRASERMDAIQDSLFTFMSTGTRGTVKEKISLNGLLKSILEELKPQVEKKGAKVKADCEKELITDRNLLRLILKNLIENALTYVKEGVSPEVEILCRDEEGFLVIEVIDNGIGIPEDKREEIFKPFVRLHSMEVYAGTGLGLSIVKKAVSLLEGFIGVKPNEKGGSIFYVKLPYRGVKA